MLQQKPTKNTHFSYLSKLEVITLTKIKINFILLIIKVMLVII